MIFPYKKMTEIETNYTNFTGKHNFPRNALHYENMDDAY